MRAWLPLLVALLGCEGAKKPFTCSSYDDDGKYDAYECSSYDVDACEVQCRNGTLCDRLCGSGNVSCATGGGAVCAMRVLSDIDAVCASLAGGRGEPASAVEADAAALAALAAASPPSRALRGATHPQIANEGQGCDDHVYCEYCVGQPSCVALVASASRYVSVSSTSFGPIAMALLRGLDAVCANRSAWFDADDGGGTISSVAGGDSPGASSGGPPGSSGFGDGSSRLASQMRVVREAARAADQLVVVAAVAVLAGFGLLMSRRRRAGRYSPVRG